MSLRVRIFLAVGFVYVFLIGYLYAVWMPDAAERQIEVYHRLQERELGTLGEVLLPMVVAGQLGDIHDTLDALRTENAEWLSVELRDLRERRLYPLAGTPVTETAEHAYLRESPLQLNGSKVATLRVLISDAPLLAIIRAAQTRLLGALAAATLGALAFVALVVELAVRRPVGRIAQAAHELAAGRFDTPLPTAGRDEIGELVRAFATMRQQVEDTQAGLRQLNETLAERVRQEVAANRDKDHMLIQQSRLAAMGEMVHNIAHQWRQPLNSLGLVIRNLKDDYDYDSLTPEVMTEATRRAQKILQSMSTTIDDFREFFRPDKEKVFFDVGKAVKDAVFIMEASLKHYNIRLEAEIPEHLTADGFPSQFSQAVLNVLMNAKEALQDTHTEDGRIRIEAAREDGWIRVRVEDNAGGIDEQILPKIFDPYFTTKDKGSGIGLYMTKMIIENNMDGQVRAANGDAGARLELRIPALTAAEAKP